MFYRFIHWVFQWKQDEDGDIAFVVFNRLSFLKYKEHTIVSLRGETFTQAGKWQGFNEDKHAKRQAELRSNLDSQGVI